MKMIDRHLVGDVALAVLLAIPAVAISRPQPFLPKDRHSAAVPLVQSAAAAQRPPLTPHSSLLG
jgi:hypothetical protein